MRQRCGAKDGVCLGKVQPEPQEKPEEGLQPGTSYIDVRLGLAPVAKGTGVREVQELQQAATRAHSPMEELPANIPGGLWNQSGAGSRGYAAQ